MAGLFDGTSSQYFSLSGTPDLTGFTVACWIRLTVTGDDNVGIGVGGNSSSSLICPRIAGLTDYRFVYPGGGATASPTSNQDIWFYCAAVYTGESTPGSSADGTVDWYIHENGSSLASWTDSGQFTGRSDLSSGNFTIGAGPTAFWFHDGQIALVKVWENTLSSAELLTEAQYRNPQVSTGLWAHYLFESGALTTDSSGNGRTLTNNNTVTFSSLEPSDIVGDDPAAGGSALPLVNAMMLS